MPPSQLYAHTNGDSWDYLQIAPDLSKEQQDEVDAAAKKHRQKTGFAASLEFRTMIASHTDTFTIGPVERGRISWRRRQYGARRPARSYLRQPAEIRRHPYGTRFSKAKASASAFESTSSLSRMFWTWLRAVRREMWRRRAMLGVDRWA